MNRWLGVALGTLVIAATAAAGESLGRPADSLPVTLEAVVTGDASRGFWRRLVGKREIEPFRRPYAVAWEGADLVVADPGGARVLRVDPKGRIESSAEGLLVGPVGIASCRGLLWVTDSQAGTVELLDRRLARLRRVADGLYRPTGIACDGRTVVVAETGRHRLLVAEVAADPPAEPEWRVLGGRGERPGQFNFPTAVAIDGDTVWVGDTLNFRVQRLALATGEALDMFGALGDASGETPRIKGLTVDRDGRLWITDAHLDEVALFERDGTYLTSFGGRGPDAGEFSFPAGVAAHSDGRVAVVDSFNRRIQVFRGTDKRGAEGRR